MRNLSPVISGVAIFFIFLFMFIITGHHFAYSAAGSFVAASIAYAFVYIRVRNALLHAPAPDAKIDDPLILALISSLPHPVAVVDASSNSILHASDGFVGECDDMTFFIRSGGSVVWRCPIVELAAKKASAEQIIAIETDAGKRSVRNYVSPVVERDGSVRCMLISQQDITEDVRNSLAMKQNATFFQKVIDTIPLPVFFSNTSGEYLGGNAHFSDMLGLPMEQITGKKPEDIFTTPGSLTSSEISRIYTLRMPGGYSGILGINGQEKYVDVMMASFAGNDEKTSWVVGVLHDQTEKIHAYSAMQNAERKFASIFHATPDGFIITRLSDGKIIELNDSFLHMVRTHYPALADATREDILGKTSLEMGFWENLDARDSFLKELEQTGGVRNFETYVSHGGTKRLLSLSAERTVINDQPSLAVILRDITVEKQLNRIMQVERERFFTLLEMLPGFVLLVDPLCVAHYANRTARSIFGSSEALLVCEHITNADVIIQTVLESHRPVHKELTLKNSRRYSVVFYSYTGGDGEQVIVILGMDITERKQIEDALIESQANYHALFQNMQDGYAFCALERDEHGAPSDFIFLETNNAFERQFHDAISLASGHHARARFEAETESDIDLFDTFANVSETGEQAFFDTWCAATSRWFSIAVYSPKKGYFVLITKDITDTKLADIKLRNSEEKLGRIFRMNPEAMVLFRLSDGAGIDANDAFYLLTGLRQHGQREVHFNDITLHKEGEEQRCLTLPELASAKNWNMELTCDGVTRTVLLSSEQMGLDGEDCCLLILQDVTEWKEAVERIRTLSTAMEQSSVSIMITSPSGVIEYINPMFTQLTGYEPEEIIGRKPSVLKSDVHTRSFYAELWRTISAGKYWRGEMLNRRKNGQYYWEFNTISPVKNDNGEIVNYISFKQDITEERLVREELKHARDQAQAASKAKSEFLANMSHEIRTPMNGIIGMTELTLDTSLDSEQREYLEMVKNSAQSMMQIINDLLDFSKIESGKVDIEHVPFALDEILHQAMEQVAVSAHTKGLEVVVRVAPDTPLYLKGDPVRIKQVLVNLLGNAVKFTDMGYVVLAVEQKKVPMRMNEVEIIFSVKDSGIGIPTDQQGKIFESFTQADGSYTRKYGGTGLGLAISKRFVNLMGGDIWVESAVGIGSTFSFELPLEIDNSVHSFSQYQSLPKLPECTVAIVDPTEVSRESLKGLVEAWGIRVILAESLLETMPADVTHLLADVSLLDKGKFAAAEAVRNLTGCKDATVCALTPYGSRRKCIDDVSFLEKPVRPKLLYDLLAGKQKYIISASETTNVMRGNENIRILIAEDNAVNQYLVANALKKRGFTTVTANNGREAIEKAENEHFDLIFMDIQMPEMDGIEATGIIRSGGVPGMDPAIPVIALTAHALKGDRERFISLGMTDYVSKPIHVQELISMMEKYIPAQHDVCENVPEHPVQHPLPVAPVQPASVPETASAEQGDHAAFVAEIIPQVRSLHRYVSEENALRLEQSAHVVRLRAVDAGHTGIKDATFRIELAARKNNFTKAAAVIEELLTSLQASLDADEKQ